MAAAATESMPGTETDDFAFQRSSPLSLRHPSTFSTPPAPPLEHSYDDETSDDLQETSERPIRPSESITHHHALSSNDRRLSGRSSISSFPASVLHHDPQTTPSRFVQHDRHDSFGKNSSPRRHRGLAAAFRNPSSVIEMQLNDDTGDDTESVVSHHRRSGSRMSVRSHGSNHSSPSKRGSRSLTSSPKKSSGLRKEFPLVLLHCTLLPPTNNWLNPTCNNDLFAALLPDGYRQRWTQLQDKLSSAEVKSRGILLPHPQEDYELLEERLLEALELETPRIQGAHFDDKGVDSGFEDGSQSEGDSDDKCPDCGKQIGKAERRWEIKVFAANGLMKGAAWTAAWRDMEKVDVQVDVFMPEDIRREVNTRLEALHAAEEEARMAEDAASTAPEQHLHEDISPEADIAPGAEEQYAPRVDPVFHSPSVAPRPPASTIEQLLQDRKNILILLLSIIVAVYAVVLPMTGKVNDRSSLPITHDQAKETAITSTAIWTTTIVAQESQPLPATSADSQAVPQEPAHQSSGSISVPAASLEPEPASSRISVNQAASSQQTEQTSSHMSIEEAAPSKEADNTNDTTASPISEPIPEPTSVEHEDVPDAQTQLDFEGASGDEAALLDEQDINNET